MTDPGRYAAADKPLIRKHIGFERMMGVFEKREPVWSGQ